MNSFCSSSEVVGSSNFGETHLSHIEVRSEYSLFSLVANKTCMWSYWCGCSGPIVAASASKAVGNYYEQQKRNKSVVRACVRACVRARMCQGLKALVREQLLHRFAVFAAPPLPILVQGGPGKWRSTRESPINRSRRSRKALMF